MTHEQQPADFSHCPGGDRGGERADDSASTARLTERARAAAGPLAAGDHAPALQLARELGDELPVPGEGRTLELWRALAAIAAVDLAVARVVEPHLDALAILHQASEAGASSAAGRGEGGGRVPGWLSEGAGSVSRWRGEGGGPVSGWLSEGAGPVSRWRGEGGGPVSGWLSEGGTTESKPTWGVFAAEGPGMRLVAERGGADKPDGDKPDGDAAAEEDTGEESIGWRLSGRKPWCSLGGIVSHALVTAHVDDDRRLFAVDLSRARTTDQPWVARGLASIPSTALDFDGAPAIPVGEAGWYLRRPGFWWGGMGVAAIWAGGAAGLARSLLRAAEKREPDQLAQAHVGALDHRFAAMWALFEHAATAVDGGRAEGGAGERLALQVRRTAAELAEDTLRIVGHALGPGPLAGDEEHARRAVDLEIYVRQDHAERDDAALGRSVLAAGATGDADGWWHG